MRRILVFLIGIFFMPLLAQAVKLENISCSIDHGGKDSVQVPIKLTMRSLP